MTRTTIPEPDTAPTAEDVIRLLDLEPHPTCGYTLQSYRSANQIPAEALPQDYRGSRCYASALYFLVTPEARIVLHRIRSDQIYHHYLGDALEVLLLYPDGTGEVRVIGGDLAAGLRPQLLVPGGTWHISRVRPPGRFALLGTTEWPGFDPSDLELGNLEQLQRAYPALAGALASFCRPAAP